MRLNQNNAYLLLALSILYILITLSVGFILLNTSEMAESRRYYHSTKAFWMAEAGLNMFMKDPSMLDDSFSKLIPYAEGTIQLVRDDSKPLFRFITSTGMIGGVEKRLQISYSANVPEVYNNSISTKGDITISGNSSSIIVNDQIRSGGKLINNSKFGYALFEDHIQGQSPALTSLNYANSYIHSSTESFNNFKKTNQDLLANYSPNEVLYIKSSGTYKIPDNGSLEDKKIIYVEGDLGGGNVIIPSNKTVAKGQNLTIITTGKVTFHQSGLQEPNSQLNIISWGGYEETVKNASSYTGLIYTHGKAVFDKINASSVNHGSLIADGGIEFGEIWSTKIFNYADMTTGNVYPPGFESLVGASLSKASPYPVAWKEL